MGSTPDDVRRAYPDAVFQDAGSNSGLFIVRNAQGRELVFGIDQGLVKVVELCIDHDAFEASTKY